MVAFDELVVDLLERVSAIDDLAVQDRAEGRRRGAEEARPPTERRVGAKDRAGEVELEEIGEPVEDAFRPEVLRADGIAPSSANFFWSVDMPFPRVVIRHPFDRCGVVPVLLERHEVGVPRQHRVSLHAVSIVHRIGDVVAT